MTDTAVRCPGAAFVEGTVDAAGFTVRYLEAGDGPAVLYLPGAGGPVMTFALDALAERFRVIVLELPGWGSQPNDVADFDGLAAQVAEIAGGTRSRALSSDGHVVRWRLRAALRLALPRHGRVAGARGAGKVPRIVGEPVDTWLPRRSSRPSDRTPSECRT